MLEIAPGKEEEFHYFRRWFAFSEWVDRVIEATEPVPAVFSEALPAPEEAKTPEVVPVGAGRRRSP